MVQIGAPRARVEGDEAVIEAFVDTAAYATDLWYRLPAAAPPAEDVLGDALFTIGLPLAMASDGQLTLDAPVSPRLLEHSELLQDILLTWHPRKLRRARLDVPARTEADAGHPDAGTVTCFTGGVDSFFSLSKRHADVSSLLFVHGLDVRLADTEFRAEISRHLGAVAARSGKTLIEGATNVRRFMSRHNLAWGLIAHGPVLASVGLLLSGQHRSMLIPASHAYTDLYPWGTHPLVDPLYSTELLTVSHDGGEATRAQKVRRLAHDPLAWDNLRVCYQRTGRYNCGECEKCVRTMVTLHLEGTLDRFSVFPARLDVERVRALPITSGRGQLLFARENLRLALEVGDTAMADALQEAIRTYQRRVVQEQVPKAPRRTLQARLRTRLERLLQPPRVVPAGLPHVPGGSAPS